ncbi:MAG: hypothetical protein WC683_04030 [bacterium]
MKNGTAVGLKGFLAEYGGLNFDNVVFRPRAPFTCSFGLVKRYRVLAGGKLEWGTPGIHFGVDRGASDCTFQGRSNGMFAPFDFYKSGWVADSAPFGTELWLHHAHGFSLRLCHMWPKDCAVIDTATAGAAITRKAFLGTIGANGVADGIHSHVELHSAGFTAGGSCALLDAILREKYYQAPDQEMDIHEVAKVYSECALTKGMPESQMVAAYRELREQKGITFLNRFKCVRRVNGKVVVYYSTEHLFDM